MNGSGKHVDMFRNFWIRKKVTKALKLMLTTDDPKVRLIAGNFLFDVLQDPFTPSKLIENALPELLEPLRSGTVQEYTQEVLSVTLGLADFYINDQLKFYRPDLIPIFKSIAGPVKTLEMTETNPTKIKQFAKELSEILDFLDE